MIFIFVLLIIRDENNFPEKNTISPDLGREYNEVIENEENRGHWV
jgi:hypothetical protein